eukprot:scaffold69976_cov53-Phaeocystis_antarctica.AAC.2
MSLRLRTYAYAPTPMPKSTPTHAYAQLVSLVELTLSCEQELARRRCLRGKVRSSSKFEVGVLSRPGPPRPI